MCNTSACCACATNILFCADERFETRPYNRSQWLSYAEPDPDGKHYQAVCNAANELIKTNEIDESQLFVWIECAPPDALFLTRPSYFTMPCVVLTLRSLCVAQLPLYSTAQSYSQGALHCVSWGVCFCLQVLCGRGPPGQPQNYPGAVRRRDVSAPWLVPPRAVGTACDSRVQPDVFAHGEQCTLTAR